MREMRVYVAWLYDAMVTHECQRLVCPRVLSLGPRTAYTARMHHRLRTARYEAVVDEKVFFVVETRIATLEITRVVRRDAMP